MKNRTKWINKWERWSKKSSKIQEGSRLSYKQVNPKAVFYLNQWPYYIKGEIVRREKEKVLFRIRNIIWFSVLHTKYRVLFRLYPTFWTPLEHFWMIVDTGRRGIGGVVASGGCAVRDSLENKKWWHQSGLHIEAKSILVRWKGKISIIVVPRHRNPNVGIIGADQRR